MSRTDVGFSFDSAVSTWLEVLFFKAFALMYCAFSMHGNNLYIAAQGEENKWKSDEGRLVEVELPSLATFVIVIFVIISPTGWGSVLQNQHDGLQSLPKPHLIRQDTSTRTFCSMSLILMACSNRRAIQGSIALDKSHP